MELLAKSNPTQTLKEHINEALRIEKMLIKSFPKIREICSTYNFWDIVRTTIVFHDLGKSHKEFQNLLFGIKNDWRHQRHELFSLPYIQSLSDEEKDIIYLVVAGHHKDFETLINILDSYSLDDDCDYYGLDLGGIEKINSFEEEFENNIPHSKVVELLMNFGYNVKYPVIHNPKEQLKEFIKTDLNKKEKIKLLLLTGAFKQCDHLSSAGIGSILNLEVDDFLYLHNTDYRQYDHQKNASSIEGNAILTAPTGSGKTEASMLWVQNQLNVQGNGRLFYILPFTASINAMFERLEKVLGEKVGLLHGKLSAFLEAKFEDDDLVDENRKKIIKEQYKTLVKPLKIVTPFQLLKNIFALKGYEKGFFEWTGGFFIFDEIHAYNPKVFAQIICLLRFSIQYLGVKVFIMTATLPSFLRKEIESAIGQHTSISASKELYNSYDRHRIVIKKGMLTDSLNLIQEYLNTGKKVLIVCNTVKQAQYVFETINCEKKVLLHGAFTAFDRSVKESQIFEEDNQLLVGTQAIEVSLDIDYDVIFSEPAPLDALIQRFGRVNRKRSKGISECLVFEDKNEADKFIYQNEKVISRTIQVLREKEKENSGVIKEDKLQEMIDFVYPDWDREDKEDYDKITSLLENFINNELKPFIYSKKQEEDFYEQFDGVKVLPSIFLEEYIRLLKQNYFIKAESLKVQISSRRFKALIHNNGVDVKMITVESVKTRKLIEQKVFVINREYNPEYGLKIDCICRQSLDVFL